MKKIFISYPALSGDSLSLMHFVRHKLMEAGFEVLTLDREISHGLSVFETVQDIVRRASIVLCVFPPLYEEYSRRSEMNPRWNIAFEIGYAMGIGKKVILLKHPDINLPSDLQGLLTIPFDVHDSSWVYDLIRRIGDQDLDDDDLHYQLGARPELVFELFKKDKNAFERIDTRAFEQLVSHLFQRRGYAVSSTPERMVTSYDFAVSGLNLGGRTLVEVKKFSSNTRVSVGVVQQLMGAVYAERAERGILISTSDYTRSALDFANRCEPKIELWNMDDLERNLRL